MSVPPTIVMGLLGWSNKRSGLEFYRYDENIIPRHDSEWGDLLVREHEAIFNSEGSPVLVVVFPRATATEELVSAVGLIGEIWEER